MHVANDDGSTVRLFALAEAASHLGVLIMAPDGGSRDEPCDHDTTAPSLPSIKPNLKRIE
jgi:hypothetical protein